MRVMFDTDTKTTAFIEDNGAAMIVHPVADTVAVTADGTAMNAVTGQPWRQDENLAYGSEIMQMMHSVMPRDAGKANPTQSEGDREGRSRVLLDDSGEYNYPAPTRRTVYEFVRPSGSAAVAVHFNGVAGKVRVELAGDPGGAVNGGAALGANGKAIEGTVMEGNLDAYTKTVTVTGTLDVNLRLDGGAPVVLLVVSPL